MKTMLTITIIALLAISCTKKKDSAKPTVTTTTTFKMGFIPHWISTIAINSFADTLFTYKVGDTTKVKHGGISYYIWWYQANKREGDLNYTFTDSLIDYPTHCWISKVLYDTTYPSFLCSVSNRIYFNEVYKKWDTVKFSISINTNLDSFHIIGGNGYDQFN